MDEVGTPGTTAGAPGRRPLNPLVRAVYAAGGALTGALTALAPATSEHKAWRALGARRGLLDRLGRAVEARRDPARPLAWFHAPSVGEGLQARPVIEALRTARPDVQVAYTFFSPSAERFAAGLGADITDYLPFDTGAHARALCALLRPSVLVFSKLDVWPLLVREADRRGIPTLLLSATLAERSGRRGWWSRQLLREAYAALDGVGAIDAAHGERLLDLGVRREALEVMGDTRFDQVAARAAAVDRDRPLLRALAGDRFTLVAGSTWPSDESVLLPAWSRFRAAHANTRLVIAPHEPTPTHTAPILQWAQAAGWSAERVSDVEAAGATDADVVLVDRVGVLGDLYAIADAAFVGGGFHAAGLHSLIEAAAYGVPVLFGPQHDMSREAALLLAAGGGVAVHSTDDLRTRLETWHTSDATRRAAGERALELVTRELGATARALRMVLAAL